MAPMIAGIVSIALLAALDAYLTAALMPIPTWITFIAWGSFFTCGGGMTGFGRSIASNWTGILIGALTLLGIAMAPKVPLMAAVCVGAGSGAVMLVALAGRLFAPPAMFFGFASTVGTIAATGHELTRSGLDNPLLVTAFGMLIGVSFGRASELLGKILTARG